MPGDGSDLRKAQLETSVLEQLALNMDESMLSKVLAMFIADGHELIAQIEVALASGDHDLLAKHVHKLSGNTATCGQNGLSQILYNCERSIRTGDISKARNHAREFLALGPSGFEILSSYRETLKT